MRVVISDHARRRILKRLGSGCAPLTLAQRCFRKAQLPPDEWKVPISKGVGYRTYRYGNHVFVYHYQNGVVVLVTVVGPFSAQNPWREPGSWAPDAQQESDDILGSTYKAIDELERRVTSSALTTRDGVQPRYATNSLHGKPEYAETEEQKKAAEEMLKRLNAFFCKICGERNGTCGCTSRQKGNVTPI